MLLNKIKKSYKNEFEKNFQVPDVLDKIKGKLEFNSGCPKDKKKNLLLSIVYLNLSIISIIALFAIINVMNVFIRLNLNYEYDEVRYAHEIVTVSILSLLIVGLFLITKIISKKENEKNKK